MNHENAAAKTELRERRDPNVSRKEETHGEIKESENKREIVLKSKEEFNSLS